MIESPEKAGLGTLAGQADLAVSFCRGGMDPSAANDELAPRDAKDHSAPNFDFWPHKGSAEWLQYDFGRPVEVRSCTVWWFDDTGRGECRVPAAWRLSARAADGAWKPVEVSGAYPVEKDKPCEVSFAPVKTDALRLEVQLPPKFSVGVYEWSVR
jgi:hypothetical protein